MSSDRAAPLPPRKLAWGVLAYNLLVIAWGAFVRASGSGAGCGRHWPLCNGEVIPRPQRIETVIEMTHRLTSGIALISVLVLLVAVRRALPPGHRARRAAALSMGFMLGEALLGAGLVLFELVAHDASMKRALSMALHLGNTFFLLAALSLTAYWLGPSREAPATLERRGLAKALVCSAVVAVLVVAISGSIAALGDTLFPARSLREGIAQDLSPFAHVFVRLRVLHPFLAMGAGLVVVMTATIVRGLRPSPRLRLVSRGVTVLFCLQLTAGVLNVWLLAPVWMQLVHLLLADATWIALVFVASETLAAPVGETERATDRQAAPVT